MAFVDLLINETSLKFELGNKSIAVMSALISTINNRELGGVEGFLNRFRKAGFDHVVEEWMNGNSQTDLAAVDVVIAFNGKIIDNLLEKTGVPNPLLTEILAFQIPPIIAHISSNLAIASMRPDDIRKALWSVASKEPEVINPPIISALESKPIQSFSNRLFRSLPFINIFLNQES